MKLILKSTVAAIAIIGFAGISQASTSGSYAYSNGGNYNTSNGPNATTTLYHEAIYQSPENSAPAGNVTETFTLHGNVTKDCSYFDGGTSTHDLNLGTIGVNTDNNQVVSHAFNQVSQNQLQVETYTAGCNTNNTVDIEKHNGTQGLLNTSAAGYDSDQFTANIPYSVQANFTGTTNLGGGGVGTSQVVTAGTGAAGATWTGGAWRSHFLMTVTAPAPTKGLLAGDYSDTITVTLTAS